MRRHRRACRRQVQERQRAKGRQIDLVRLRREIRNGVELVRVGIGNGQIDEDVIAIAAGQPVSSESPGDGIVAVVGIDSVFPGAAIDNIVAIISLDGVITRA